MVKGWTTFRPEECEVQGVEGTLGKVVSGVGVVRLIWRSLEE